MLNDTQEQLSCQVSPYGFLVDGAQPQMGANGEKYRGNRELLRHEKFLLSVMKVFTF